MYLADHLSRAYLPDQGEQDEEFQVFALDIEALNPLDSLTVSSERLVPQLQKATERDPVLQILKTTVLVGWPEQKVNCQLHSENTGTTKKKSPCTTESCLKESASSFLRQSDQRSSPEVTQVT